VSAFCSYTTCMADDICRSSYLLFKLLRVGEKAFVCARARAHASERDKARERQKKFGVRERRVERM